MFTFMEILNLIFQLSEKLIQHSKHKSVESFRMAEIDRMDIQNIHKNVHQNKFSQNSPFALC